MAQGTASGTNTYVSSFDQKAKLIVNYSRNKKDFLVNALTQIIPVEKVNNYFLKLKPEAAARILANPEESVWADGQPRPVNQNFNQDYEFVQYFTKRRSYNATVGYMSSEQAVWDLIAAQTAVLAQQAITRRTIEFYSLLADSAIYPAANTSTATSLGGGLWGAATSTNRYIQKSINGMKIAISKATYGAVKASQLTLVISPTIADAMARSAEIADYVAQSTAAPEFLRYELWQEQTANYGLPATLYGCRICVDETLYTTSKPITSNSYTATYAASANSVYMLAAPGELKQTGEQSTAVSSVGLFIYNQDDMSVEIEDQPMNRLKRIHVTDGFHVRDIAPESMYLLTAVLS